MEWEESQPQDAAAPVAKSGRGRGRWGGAKGEAQRALARSKSEAEEALVRCASLFRHRCHHRLLEQVLEGGRPAHMQRPRQASLKEFCIMQEPDSSVIMHACMT
jgi:hypothetical protein